MAVAIVTGPLVDGVFEVRAQRTQGGNVTTAVWDGSSWSWSSDPTAVTLRLPRVVFGIVTDALNQRAQGSDARAMQAIVDMLTNGIS
jgi:hypothetical protein